MSIIAPPSRLIMSLTLILGLLIGTQIATAQDNGLPPIAEKTNGLEKLDGFVPIYWNNESGELWLEIDQLNTDLLYINWLADGVGSNDIGLDRGQIGNNRLVRFERKGNKILMIQPNLDYRASSDNAKERASVEEAFAKSVLWGFEVAARTGDRYLVNATPFLMRDAHGVADRLKGSGQGNFSIDDSRSAINREKVKNFPQNTELDVLLTFTGSGAGGYLRSVTPSSDAVTVHTRHSFVQLPEDGYEPRKLDPRSGFFGMNYQDYSVPIGEEMTQRFINRHRLEKKNPEAEVSEPVEPIVYYLDPGTPEPVRSALLDGARWWNQAFEAIGYKDAFQVKMLPEDADPLDVRYNVIQWVHRSTRGWSYGMSITDPRTGEIIKGHVSLGSLRVRQDYLIAEGLLSPYESIDQIPADDPMLEMALARIRQLSAHEVGHTLGIAHNFAASTNNRSSVMDYPHPLIQLNDGEIDLSDAYDTDIGEWDKAVIAYGYQDFPAGTDESAALQELLQQNLEQGLRYISDRDARPLGGAHPYAHLWENGTDAAQELNRMMKVRQTALDEFDASVIRGGQPMALLEDKLVPIYLLHRYQVEAAVKLVGGLHYSYNMRGDGQPSPEVVEWEQQQKAIDALLATLTPDALRMPDAVLDQVPPRPYGYSYNRELFDRNTGLTFDPLAAAESAAELTVRGLLHPERAARLVQYHGQSMGQKKILGLFKRSDDQAFGFSEVIEQLWTQTWGQELASGHDGQLQGTVRMVVLRQLLELASDDSASDLVRMLVLDHLEQFKRQVQMNMDQLNEHERAMRRYAVKLINLQQQDPEHFRPSRAADVPPGSPIGSGVLPLQCSWR
ncbi:MAG: zinc-dependent metalloprotease [Bacteroidota bacterium]